MTPLRHTLFEKEEYNSPTLLDHGKERGYVIHKKMLDKLERIIIIVYEFSLLN